MPDARPRADDLLPLTPAVLHILLAVVGGERHGYAIAQEVEALTEGQIRMGPGTLYGSLQRCLAARLIEETAADDERRRCYRVTPLGARALELELSRLARVVAVARRKRLLPAPELA